MATIAVALCAFGTATTYSAEVPDALLGTADPEAIADLIFEATNLQSDADPVWRILRKEQPWGRTHTSLSVGDQVSVNGVVLCCEVEGWSLALPPIITPEEVSG